MWKALTQEMRVFGRRVRGVTQPTLSGIIRTLSPGLRRMKEAVDIPVTVKHRLGKAVQVEHIRLTLG